MRVLVQKSKESSVEVEGKTVGKIKNGYVLLVGFTNGDGEKEIDYMINKVLNLRIFEDENGIMNLSIKDHGGDILSVSQFTLYADSSKGHRPSYVNAMHYEEAEKLFDLFNKKLSEHIHVETGIFRADMVVNIQNDGPTTIVLESK